MFDFTYHNPTKILFGKDAIERIREEIPSGAHVLMTYGGGSIHRNGVYERVKAALQGYRVTEFGGIEPNPQYATLMRAVELGRQAGVDFLLAVGGGSVLDGTKFIAAAIPFAGETWDIVEKRLEVREAVPLGAVLTLPGTGSEMNGWAVISHAEKRAKLAFYSPLVYPRFSALDPQTTFSLPPRQTANGIVDAFAHVMEQYVTYPVNAALQDRIAEAILVTLIEQAPKVMQNPTDYDARANIMWCATVALNGIVGVGVPQDWATHAIGHEITALYGIDHARTLALVLPAVLEFKREQKREKLLQYAERVWNLREGDEQSRIAGAIQRTRAFFESLDIPTRLSAYGIGAEAIPAIVRQLEAHGQTALGEHGDITPDVAAKILERCL
ncbi:MAG: iron-containing alcohol dehydrogenase [Armatimonadota bacterium]|nr:iron-containing alcohol dehydrogenase [bacterium]MCS7309741.1 iron-containing alcohol dehydrogenase [Armatimonadota bacterium]MDW8104316.1 iron-containing alcohol dehydrogenase [Armatimonadota bacterium]MDW8290350.1 iron-containing alcohol dehydrogenase [Armatimonadota bacterium]